MNAISGIELFCMDIDMDSIRHHTSSDMWLGFAEAVVRGGNVVLQFLVARALGREQYGIFAYALSLAMVVVPAGGIGVPGGFVPKGDAARGGIVPAPSGRFPLRLAAPAAPLACLVPGSLAACERSARLRA